MRILGISGSLRHVSYNTRLLKAACEMCPAGVGLEISDRLGAVPPYNQDHEQREWPPPAVRRLRQAITESDAVVIATPEYNGSIPGQLKNALDWASRPIASTVLRGKPVAVIGASVSGFGAVWAQADLRRVLTVVGAHVLDYELAIANADGAFDEEGALRNRAHHEALAELIGTLAAEARRTHSKAPLGAPATIACRGTMDAPVSEALTLLPSALALPLSAAITSVRPRSGPAAGGSSGGNCRFSRG